MKRRVILTSLILILLILPLLPTISHSQESTEWIHLDITPTTAVTYDYDSDGVEEIVFPGSILEGYTLIASPYPNEPFVSLADLDGSGINKLVLYGDGKLYVYDGMKKEKELIVPNVIPITTQYAYAFGNTVVWNNRTYTVKTVSRVVPVADRTHLYIAYNRNGDLRILDTSTQKEKIIYPEFTPLYGILYDNTIYIVANNTNGNTAIIQYPLSSYPRIGVYTVKYQSYMGFNRINHNIYIKADNKLYSITPSSLLLVSDWEPVSHDYRYIYLYKNGYIGVYDASTGATVATYKLPVNGKPQYVTGYPKLVVVYPTGGTYVYYTGQTMYIIFYGPTGVRAGENYTFKIRVYPPTASYTIQADGLPVSINNTRVVFNNTGVHSIRVEATNGIVKIVRTFHIYVYPRHLTKMSLEVTKPPKPFSIMEIILHTEDNGKPVNLSYIVEYNGNEYQGITNRPLDIPIKIPEQPRINIKVNITSRLYGAIIKQYYIPVEKEPVKPIVSFLGNGTFQIDITPQSKGEIELNGTVKIYLGHENVYTGKLPAIVKLDNPGNYTLLVKYYPQHQYAFPTTTLKVNITYLGKTAIIPTNTAGIIAVDHIINQTKVVVKNNTITVTAPPTYSHPVRHKTTTGELLTMLGIGVGAGIPIGMVLGLQYLKRKKRELVDEEPVSEEDKELFSEE